MEHNSNVVVMLSQLYENDRVSFSYWPICIRSDISMQCVDSSVMYLKKRMTKSSLQLLEEIKYFTTEL